MIIKEAALKNTASFLLYDFSVFHNPLKPPSQPSPRWEGGNHPFPL
jgi:hypothetical protein